MKLRLIKGDHFTYLITQENTVQQSTKEVLLFQKMALKINHSVIELLADGNFLIEASFKSLSIEIKSNGTLQRYNSDTVNVSNKLYKTLSFLTGIKLTYEVSPLGVVSNLSGFEPIKKKIESDPMLSSLLRSFGSERFLMELYNYIPVKNVGVGDKWIGTGILPDMMNLKYDIQYHFKEASQQNLKLNKQASFSYSAERPVSKEKTMLINETGTQKGTLLLDPKTLLCLSSDLDQQIEIVIPDQTTQKDEKKNIRYVITHTNMLLIKK